MHKRDLPAVDQRVELIRCNDPYTRLKPGLKGTVIGVDDADTVHVHWDNGVILGLIREAGDEWRLISE